MQNIKLSSFYSLLNYVTHLRGKKANAAPAGRRSVIPINNARYSAWHTLNMKFSMASNIYEEIIKADAIGQAILNTGTVLTYLRNHTLTGHIQTVNAGTYMEEVFGEDGIELISTIDYSGFSYRYIIVPFRIKNRKNAQDDTSYYTDEQLREMSYDDIMNLLYKR